MEAPGGTGHRGQTAESANAGLKGGFTNIERKLVRVMGITKVTVMLAFTIAGYNIDRIRSFVIRKQQTSAKRRRGTWDDLLDAERSPSGRDTPT